MSRQLYLDCQYLKASCVCVAIKPITHQTQVVILQHPSEIKHPKNTVKLLSLLLEHLTIAVGETPQDFKDIQERLSNPKADASLVFPTQHSKPLSAVGSDQVKSPKTLVLIDGSWRKAKKIFYLNPWLNALPCIALEKQQSIYQIRKTRMKGSMSTLEATAQCLQHLEGTHITPFNTALKAMMDNHLRYINLKAPKKDK